MRRVVLVFLFSVALVVSRRPDVLFHAQFWAEDGKMWYADAYNLGVIQPFLHPAAGYFDTLPRLAALFVQVLPFSLAPLAFNCMAIVIQVLPAQFLMSSRCREMGSTTARCLFAFLYLALPNSQELHANITNAQWRFALLAILIFFAQPARTALWNAFDLSVVALSGLSGPFIIFLAPITAILHRSEPRNRWRFLLLTVAGFTAMVQVTALLVSVGSERPMNAVRAASPELLIRILARQVFLAALVGKRVLSGFSLDSTSGLILAIVAVSAGFAIELYVFLKAPIVWKAVILFSLCMLGASMAYPMTLSPQWPALLASGGGRYWFFPIVAFVSSLVWMLHGRNPVLIRGTAVALLLLMSFGIIQDWGLPRAVDLHLEEYARRFSELPSGATLFIPINPVGWSMQLMKR
jgi:hypothetical protein